MVPSARENRSRNSVGRKVKPTDGQMQIAVIWRGISTCKGYVEGRV